MSARRAALARRLALAGSTPLFACAVLAGCAAQRSPPPAPAMVVQPVEVTTTYITAHARRFTRGEYAIVEVCVAPDGAIDRTRVTQSSADKAFDAAAVGWARLAHYRPQLENGRPVYGCQEVRVEINRNPGVLTGSGADSALG
jgi:TonB family protein